MDLPDGVPNLEGLSDAEWEQIGLTPEECLAGVTREAARALGLGNDRGTLDIGKRADIAVWNLRHPRDLSYWLGGNPLSDLLIAGRSVGPNQ